MEITMENALLLGNPRFCSSAEAITRAKKFGFLRGQNGFSIAQRIRHFGEENKIVVKVWVSVLTREDVSPNDALKYMEESKIEDVFVNVLSRKDIPWEKAVEYAEMYNNSLIWNSVLGRLDLPLSKALFYVKQINNPIRVMKSVFERNDFKNLPHSKILAYMEKFDYWPFWNEISERECIQRYLHEIDIDRAYFCMMKMRHLKVYSIVLSRLDLNLNKAISFMNQKCMPAEVWISVLNRPDVSVRKALYWAKNHHDHLVLEAVMKREDVKEYLSLPNLIREKPI